MKLKKFDLENTRSLRMEIPLVRINIILGTFGFNKSAVELLKLQSGDKLDILQDQERRKDWYISKTNSKDGFPIRIHTKSEDSEHPSFIVDSIYMTKLILNSLNLTDKKSVDFKINTSPVHENGMELYAIITSKQF